MATAYFYTLTKRKNSTLQPTGGTSLDVNLKSGTSFISPTFLLNLGSTPTYNYVSYEGRYYFITDIVSVRNDLWEIQCDVDVLATYKSAILASTQFVSYSSVSGGSWLADTRIPVLKSTVAAKNTANTGILSNIGCYILSAVGKDRCNTFMIYNEGTLGSLMNSIQRWDDQDVNDLMDYLDFTDVEHALESVGTVISRTSLMGNAYQAAPSCIRSCIWVPFDYALAPSSGDQEIWLGMFATGVRGYLISGKPVTGSATVSIPWHFSDWRRGYCEQIYLYLPLVGLVSLSADSLTQVSSITVNWSVTYSDGTIAYEVKAGNEIIGAYGAQCSSNYPIGIAQQASAGQVLNTAISGVERTVCEAVDSGLNVAGMALEGAAGLLKTTWDIGNAALTSNPTCVGGIGGGAGSGLDLTITCYSVAHNTVVNPSDMAATMGVPTQKPILLSTCSGFCQCVNAHVAISGSATEMDMIDAYINSGFYIE